MAKKFEKVIDLAIRRGFFYPSSEIYQGKSGFYDYGSLGTILKRKIENLWKKYFQKLFDNIWEIEPCLIMDEKVFIASKHLELFNDPITECTRCKRRFRADKLIEEKLGIKAESLTLEQMSKIFEEEKVRCPECSGKLSKVRLFNLMFPIFIGPESGNLFAKLNEIKKYFEKKKRFEKIKKNLEKGKETYDGNVFLSILKYFEKDISNVYYHIEDYFYIFNERTEEAVSIDVIERKAKYYIKQNIPIREFENVEEEFEKFLEKIEPYFSIDLEEELRKLVEYYKEALKNRMFLRPETAQGPYINFPREIKINRNKLPLGLLVIGKAFRNEISPRQTLIRLREFTQAELQIFFDKDYWKGEFEKIKGEKINVLLVEDRNKKDFLELKLEEIKVRKKLPEFYLYFMFKIWDFLTNILKLPKEKIRFFELDENEKAFYNKYHFDIEVYLDDIGWLEIAGIHYRVLKINKKDIEKIKSKKVREILEKVFGDKEEIEIGYDLFNHLVLSENLGFVVYKNNKPLIPLELEISFGIDRLLFSILYLFYDEEEKRIVLRLPENLSPIQISVFPLLEKKELIEKAKYIYNLLKNNFKVFYDESGSIGRRYRRQDEIGTPFCITIDYQTLEDNTVTIRFRDNMEQIRIKIEKLKDFFSKRFKV